MHLVRGGAELDGGGRAGLSEILPLASAPFPITIGPEQAVAHRAWREARERVLAAALASPSLVLLLGPPGTGKSLLLQDLAQTLRAGGVGVLLHGRGDLAMDPAAEWAAEHGTTRCQVVLIDEANRLNEAMLERLGRLGACTIVLARTATPADDEGTGTATVVRLAPLVADEVGAFLAARLSAAGLDAGVLSGGAVARLAERSGGVPRVLNMLAGAALFLARAEEASRVEAGHVDEAAALRDGDAGTDATKPPVPLSPGRAVDRTVANPARPATRTRRLLAVASLGVITAAAAACGWLVLGHGERAQPSRLAAATAPREAPAPFQPSPTTPVPSSVPVRSGHETPAAASAAPARTQAANKAVAAVPTQPPQMREPAQTRERIAEAGPPEPQPLPSSAPALVLLRYPRGSAESAGQAASVAGALRAAGLMVNVLASAPRRDDRPGVRYFFAEDRDAAAAVLKAAGLSGRGTLADAAHLDAPPRPGTIELSLPPAQVEAVGRKEPPAAGRS